MSLTLAWSTLSMPAFAVDGPASRFVSVSILHVILRPTCFGDIFDLTVLAIILFIGRVTTSSKFLGLSPNTAG